MSLDTTLLFMNIYAIVEAGGEQLQLQAGRSYDIRHLASRGLVPWKQDTKLLFYRVLLVCYKSSIVLGAPWVQNAVVKGRLLHTRRNEKVTIYKMHRKKKTRRKTSYRQDLAVLLVDAIYLDNRLLVDE